MSTLEVTSLIVIALIALGKFLDSEHLETTTKERARTALVSFYFTLEKFRPDWEPVTWRNLLSTVLLVGALYALLGPAFAIGYLVPVTGGLIVILLMYLLNKATSPRTSPFSYLAALLSVIVAMIGVLKYLLS